MTSESASSHYDLAGEIRARIDDALARRDRAAAVEVALYAVRERGLDVDTLYTRVLAPLLVATGSAWQEGSERVWEEHFASATVRTIVEALYPEVMKESSRRARLGKVVVLACPPGELHDLGLRMLTDRLQLAGWNAYFLGADTPVDEIAAAANALGADLVALTAATHYNRLLLRDVIDRLKAEAPGARIGIGGPAFASSEPDWPSDEILTECNLGLVSGDDPRCEV
jgi:methanogenic corrinoid protein MtbC1